MPTPSCRLYCSSASSPRSTTTAHPTCLPVTKRQCGWIQLGNWCIERQCARDVTVQTLGHEKVHITVMLYARANGTKCKPFVLLFFMGWESVDGQQPYGRLSATCPRPTSIWQALACMGLFQVPSFGENEGCLGRAEGPQCCRARRMYQVRPSTRRLLEPAFQGGYHSIPRGLDGRWLWN